MTSTPIKDPLEGMDAIRSRQISVAMMIATLATEINQLVHDAEQKGYFETLWKIPENMPSSTYEEIQRRYQNRQYIVQAHLECKCGCQGGICSCTQSTHLKFRW